MTVKLFRYTQWESRWQYITVSSKMGKLHKYSIGVGEISQKNASSPIHMWTCKPPSPHPRLCSVTIFGRRAFKEMIIITEITEVGPNPIWLVSLWKQKETPMNAQKKGHMRNRPEVTICSSRRNVPTPSSGTSSLQNSVCGGEFCWLRCPACGILLQQPYHTIAEYPL